MTTEQLVAAARAGDPVAFAQLVGAARAHTAGVVARMLGADEVEDVVQDAVVRAYVGLSELRDPARFAAWLCGIAVNVAKMRLRRHAAERRALAGAVARGAIARPPEDEHELLELVREAVASLPPGQRDVVLLHYVDGLSCAEVAELLGRSPGAVRVGLHRARSELRARLAPLAAHRPTTKEERPMIEMTLDDVLVRAVDGEPTDQRVVVLREKGGDRLLPIWIGAAEGNMLALPLRGEATPRPVTPDLMAELVRATGSRVEQVAVTRLADDVFYAAITLDVDGRDEELDARPSDAINLAARVGAPIVVAESVLAESGTTEIGDELNARMQVEGAERGEWQSLSAELLRTVFAPPPPRRT